MVPSPMLPPSHPRMTVTSPSILPGKVSCHGPWGKSVRLTFLSILYLDPISEQSNFEELELLSPDPFPFSVSWEFLRLTFWYSGLP